MILFITSSPHDPKDLAIRPVIGLCSSYIQTGITNRNNRSRCNSFKSRFSRDRRIKNSDMDVTKDLYVLASLLQICPGSSIPFSDVLFLKYNAKRSIKCDRGLNLRNYCSSDTLLLQIRSCSVIEICITAISFAIRDFDRDVEKAFTA
ncbi:hypothetical protein AVEN_84665-1 [Araneus ventricosus]|uniref:Uncharacterized protein n=1 Tax=Araneus ventricosus TaxID=182803 RepID=A0A4Y2N778_ARAVE|nr:hypothetical protein AVEN_73333-1 [Araneus ventricosus]GBN35201.1 hypothetical protein AVEN_84665-1 [Araneus ventricosus]